MNTRPAATVCFLLLVLLPSACTSGTQNLRQHHNHVKLSSRRLVRHHHDVEQHPRGRFLSSSDDYFAARGDHKRKDERLNTDLQEIEDLPQNDEGGAKHRTALWASAWKSPWETSLFQWMADPSLTHLPLNPSADGQGGDSQPYGELRYGASALGLRQGAGEPPGGEDWDSSQAPRPPSLALSEDSPDVSEGSKRRGHHRPHHGAGVGRRDGNRHSVDSETDSRVSLTQAASPEQRERRHPHHNHNHNHNRPRRLRPPRDRRQQHRFQESRSRLRNSSRRNSSSSSSRNNSSSSSSHPRPVSLPHVAHKLPSHTPPKQMTSPILYGSSARRSRPVSADVSGLLSAVSDRVKAEGRRGTHHPEEDRRSGGVRGWDGADTGETESSWRGRGTELPRSPSLSPTLDNSLTTNVSDGSLHPFPRRNDLHLSPGLTPLVDPPMNGGQGHGVRTGVEDGEDSACSTQQTDCRAVEMELVVLRDVYQVWTC